MLFNSFPFLIFFLAVFFAYQIPMAWWAKKLLLILTSYYFYASWNPPFVILLWISTIMDWFLAKALYASRTSRHKKILLVFSLGINLGFLGFFKYGHFILQNFSEFMHLLGAHYSTPAVHILLPVGISFYTFQSLSYTLDVYSGRKVPERSFLDYALYIAFFPQLIAGPIMRAEDFLSQCKTPRQTTRSQFDWGITLMVLGLFEKMVIADFLMAPVVEKIFTGTLAPNFQGAWLGALAFSIQIFCDFAGYSTCAIGTALCFGFILVRNFHFPYAAVGFSDFWRRWHISLSTWLRDYLYIPLGGNRKGNARTYIHLMVTMLLGGLWHGAAWTFVVWGGLHGGFLCIERFLKNKIGSWQAWSWGWMRFILGAITYICICIAWVFFRSHNLSQAREIIKSMFSFNQISQIPASLSSWEIQSVLIATGIVLMLHAFFRDNTLKQIAVRIPRWIKLPMLALMFLLLWITSGEDRAFIYFQF